jgi:LysR family hydrogen peroxide-inducible transcriptional activator
LFLREDLTANLLERLRHGGLDALLLALPVPGVGSVRNGLVQIRPFATPVPTRTIGLVWRHRYPREATIKQLAEVILNHLPTAVQVLPRRHNGAPRPTL